VFELLLADGLRFDVLHFEALASMQLANDPLAGFAGR